MSTSSGSIEPSRSDWDRFMDKVYVRDDGCWEWNAVRHKKGYGIFWWNGKKSAHIVSYTWIYGAPDGDLHHRCENPWCVNPRHLVDTAHSGPIYKHRGPSRGHCSRGHEFTEENTYLNPRGERQCRTCRAESTRRYREENRDRYLTRRRLTRPKVKHAPRRCPECGSSFVPIRATKIFCSEHCQAAANNRKQRESGRK